MLWVMLKDAVCNSHLGQHAIGAELSFSWKHELPLDFCVLLSTPSNWDWTLNKRIIGQTDVFWTGISEQLVKVTHALLWLCVDFFNFGKLNGRRLKLCVSRPKTVWDLLKALKLLKFMNSSWHLICCQLGWKKRRSHYLFESEHLCLFLLISDDRSVPLMLMGLWLHLSLF